MKIPLLIPALAAILGLALAGAPITAQAQTTTTAASATSTKKVKPTNYSGSLTAIDTTANTVTIQSTTKKEGVKTLTLNLAATTKFEKNKKTATLADFAVGDKVSGSYTKDASGAMTAFSLHKSTTAKSTKPAAAAKSATPPATTSNPATPAAE